MWMACSAAPRVTRVLPVGLVCLLILSAMGAAACASLQPPSRLADYVGPRVVDAGSSDAALPDQRPIRTGLVVIFDTSAPGAVKDFPDRALQQMAEQLRLQFSQYLPLQIDAVLPAGSLHPGNDPQQWRDLGRRYDLDHLLVIVASATEQEYPMHLAVGWTTHVVPGLRRDNWSLVEVALLDLRPGAVVLVRAEGRGWATLDRPTTPDINQWYPVIWKRPLEPNWRWWPPTYESAPFTLRVIAMQEAVKRLVVNFQDAWLQKREADTSRQAAVR